MPDRRRTTASSERESRLARLGAHLTAHRFEVDLTPDGLVASSAKTQAHATGSDPGQQNLTIVCRPYEADGGRWWFFGPGCVPITAADQVIDAVVAIKHSLAGGES